MGRLQFSGCKERCHSVARKSLIRLRPNDNKLRYLNQFININSDPNSNPNLTLILKVCQSYVNDSYPHPKSNLVTNATKEMKRYRKERREEGRKEKRKEGMEGEKSKE